MKKTTHNPLLFWALVVLSFFCMLGGLGFYAYFSSLSWPQPANILIEGAEDDPIELVAADEAEREAVVSDISERVQLVGATRPHSLPSFVHLEDVPFILQAPNGDWGNIYLQNACEESSLMMAYHWVHGTSVTVQEAVDEILAVSEYEKTRFNDALDLSVADTVALMKEYFGYYRIAAFYDIEIDDIKKALASGKLVIVPVNGRILENPHFKDPGPLYHMAVVVGYDDEAGDFIMHEPGTRFGKNFRYAYDNLMEAIWDYRTGTHLPVSEIRKAMIVVTP